MNDYSLNERIEKYIQDAEKCVLYACETLPQELMEIRRNNAGALFLSTDKPTEKAHFDFIHFALSLDNLFYITNNADTYNNLSDKTKCALIENIHEITLINCAYMHVNFSEYLEIQHLMMKQKLFNLTLYDKIHSNTRDMRIINHELASFVLETDFKGGYSDFIDRFYGNVLDQSDLNALKALIDSGCSYKELFEAEFRLCLKNSALLIKRNQYFGLELRFHNKEIETKPDMAESFIRAIK